MCSGQLMQLAAQYQLPGGFEPIYAEEEKPVPPLHAKAVEALDAGDYEGARAAYKQAISDNPGDKEAKLGLEQVELLARVKNLDMAAERAAAAADPLNIEAAFNVADLDVVGGHVEDAYARLLRLFKAVPADEKTRVRERLVQLFDVVGTADARTVKAARSFYSPPKHNYKIRVPRDGNNTTRGTLKNNYSVFYFLAFTQVPCRKPAFRKAPPSAPRGPLQTRIGSTHHIKKLNKTLTHTSFLIRRYGLK